MSYHIYTTEAVVLSYKPLREADREYAILTKDLGLVHASAGGVRKEASKLRGALEPYSFSHISLVKGKDRWRVTSSSLEVNLAAKLDKKVIQSFAKAFRLLKRLVPGEAKHPELYEILKQSADYPVNASQAKALEIYMAANILAELGYLPRSVPRDLNESALDEIDKDIKNLIKTINEGIQSSNLV